MKERSILFSAPMVRALLAGTKTQTRRAIKLPKESTLHGGWEATMSGGPGTFTVRNGRREEAPEVAAIWNRTTGTTLLCPYGDVGERLWVRESYRFAKSLDDLSPSDVGEKATSAGYAKPWAPLRYEADEATRNASELSNFGGAWGKLRPGIHLPRWASRITLEITEVRAERLHEITADDARAEGVERYDDDGVTYYGPLNKGHALATVAYERLWCEINGADSWKANPWVWAITFKRVEEQRNG